MRIPQGFKEKNGGEITWGKLQKKRVLLQNTQDSLRQIQISISFPAEPQALGQARTAEVRRDARIGEAEARMQVREIYTYAVQIQIVNLIKSFVLFGKAQVAEARAEMQRMEAKLANDTEIARSKRDFDAKKASYDVEV